MSVVSQPLCALQDSCNRTGKTVVPEWRVIDTRCGRGSQHHSIIRPTPAGRHTR